MYFNEKISKLFISLIYIIIQVRYSHGMCDAGEVATYERVTGMVPMTINQTILLQALPGPESLVLGCIMKCTMVGEKCAAFVLDYSQNACFAIQIPIPPDLFGFSPLEYSRVDFQPSNLVYFEKVCIKAPQCGELAWMVERVPGFELRTENSIAMRDVTSRQACAALCIKERRFSCRSATFDPAWLDCRLSSEDRRSQPFAFVPAIGAMDYIENQCVQLQPNPTKVCSFQEFKNSAMSQLDVALVNLSYSQCRQTCDSQVNFRCRGFTYSGGNVLVDISQGSACFLHSADLTSAGPMALVERPGASYSERAPCLELLLRCSKRDASVKLRTQTPFLGRLFVRGYSGVCDVTGSGGNETALVVTQKCAMFSESSVNFNVIVQYNPILQRRGDRALNITCRYVDNLQESLNSSLQVIEDPYLVGGVAVNSSNQASAAVRIRITDRQGRQASITEVGRDLELRIEAVNTDPFDISAGQLIATNTEGTESVFLLDERGCPPDPSTFPALEKVNGSRDLVAHFRAFRFTSSTVVRFLVRVHFCLQTCPPVTCAKGGKSYGRRRRAHDLTYKATEGFPEDMPLEMDILVLPDPHAVINIRSNHSQILPRGPTIHDLEEGEEDEDHEGWCVSEGVFIGVLITWILLQLLLVAVVWTAATSYIRSHPATTVKLRNVKWDDQAFN